MRILMIAALSAAASLSLAAAVQSAPKNCPPGLAKKSTPCVPPGQAKKIYERGNRIDDSFILIEQPSKYGLNTNDAYYRSGDNVYRVDQGTKEILDLIGAIDAILN